MANCSICKTVIISIILLVKEFTPRKVEYLGCFVDGTTKVIEGYTSELNNTNSIETCLHTCIERGMYYYTCTTV